MKKEEKDEGRKGRKGEGSNEATTIGRLIEKLQEFPADRIVVDFKIEFVNKLGYPHVISSEIGN